MLTLVALGRLDLVGAMSGYCRYLRERLFDCEARLLLTGNTGETDNEGEAMAL